MIELQGVTLEERRAWLSQLLQSGTFTITFTKVDGSVRDMPCTLDAGQIPPAPVKETARPRRTNNENLSVWCVDKKEWRSFKVMNVTAVTEYTPKETVWIVALEEDPETGDLVMPIPEAVMQSQGWKIGDTLDWDVNEKTQTATLTKKQ